MAHLVIISVLTVSRSAAAKAGGMLCQTQLADD